MKFAECHQKVKNTDQTGANNLFNRDLCSVLLLAGGVPVSLWLQEGQCQRPEVRDSSGKGNRGKAAGAWRQSRKFPGENIARS